MTTLPTPRRTLRRHRLARTSTWGAALLLALTACGADSPDPDASPSASSASVAPGSATASASESGASTASADEGAASQSSDDGRYVPASEQGPARNVPKPVMPEAVKEDTPEGAEAAVKHWWDAVYYLQQTNDPEPLKAVSRPDCQFCASYIEAMTDVYKSGGWHTGSKPAVESTLSQEIDGATSVTQLVTIADGRAFDSGGKVKPETVTTKEEKQPWGAIAVFDETKNQWTVAEISYEGPES